MKHFFTRRLHLNYLYVVLALLLIGLGLGSYLKRTLLLDFLLESTVTTTIANDHNPLHSRLEQIHAPFPSSGTRDAWVYTPAGYSLSSERYPVLYLLHGSPGSENDWLVRGNAKQALDSHIRAKQLPPTLVVFPDGNSSHSDEPQYLNSADRRELNEVFVSQSLVQYVDQKYRTNPSKRALGGLSAGGYGALNIGLKHQDTFGEILSFSGYSTPLQDRQSLAYLPKSQSGLADNSPLSYVASLNRHSSAIWLGCEQQEPFAKDNSKLFSALTAHGFTTSLNIKPGGHNWALWSSQLPVALTWLGGQW